MGLFLGGRTNNIWLFSGINDCYGKAIKNLSMMLLSGFRKRKCSMTSSDDSVEGIRMMQAPPVEMTRLAHDIGTSGGRGNSR